MGVKVLRWFTGYIGLNSSTVSGSSSSSELFPYRQGNALMGEIEALNALMGEIEALIAYGAVELAPLSPGLPPFFR